MQESIKTFCSGRAACNRRQIGKTWLSAELELKYYKNRLIELNYGIESEIAFLPWRAMLCTFRVQDLALI